MRVVASVGRAACQEVEGPISCLWAVQDRPMGVVGIEHLAIGSIEHCLVPRLSDQLFHLNYFRKDEGSGLERPPELGPCRVIGELYILEYIRLLEKIGFEGVKTSVKSFSIYFKHCLHFAHSDMAF